MSTEDSSILEQDWLCGATPYGTVIAGDAIICDREPHPKGEKHFNDETGWAFW